jgi:hypothetical protein
MARSNSQSRSSRSGSSRGSSSRSRGRSSRRSSDSTFLGVSGLPGWAPYAITVVSICGLVYGLMQVAAVSEFVEPIMDDVSEFLGLSDDDDMESITSSRSYSGAAS